jgi:hypothetical protein
MISPSFLGLYIPGTPPVAFRTKAPSQCGHVLVKDRASWLSLAESWLTWTLLRVIRHQIGDGSFWRVLPAQALEAVSSVLNLFFHPFKKTKPKGSMYPFSGQK